MHYSADVKLLENRKILPNERVQEIAKRDEKRLLALILQKEGYLKDLINDGITFEYFLLPQHAHLYGFISDFFDHHGVLPTEQSFRTRLEELFDDEVTISSLVISFQKNNHAHVDEKECGPLKEGLQKRYSQQKYFEITSGGQRMVDMMKSTNDIRPELKKIGEEFLGLEAQTNLNSEVKIMKEPNRCEYFKQLRKNPDLIKEKIIYTHIEALDEACTGFERGKYMIVAAPPHGCKTAMMLNMCYRMSVNGRNCVFVCIENSIEQTQDRLISTISGIPSKKISEPWKMSDIEFSDCIKAEKKLSEMNLQIIEVEPQTSVEKILAVLSKINDNKQIDAAFVDYLDVIAPVISYKSRPDLQTADTSMRLQKWGKLNDVFVVTAQSLNNQHLDSLIKKADDDPIEAIKYVSGRGLGGSQKLWRDSDYMIALLPSENMQIIGCKVLKARASTGTNSIFKMQFQNQTGNIYSTSLEMLDAPQTEEEIKPDVAFRNDRKHFMVRYIVHGKRKQIGKANSREEAEKIWWEYHNKQNKEF